MKKEKSILIVFPDEWLQYSPSVLNLYRCCSETGYTKLVYVDNGRFQNKGLAEHSKSIHIGKTAAYFWRKTFGYKFYKVLRLIWTLIFIKLFDRRYDTVIAIDSSGYAATRLLFGKAVYFSLETEKDVFYNFSKKLGIDTLLIQSEERREFMVGDDPHIKTFFLQNAPIIDEHQVIFRGPKEKRILYMGNIEFGYGLEHFVECIRTLDDSYSLTMKGIKNDRYYNWLSGQYADMIQSGKLRFDFNYVAQEQIIEYVSQYYIGITGYDLELARQSFNYFSSPAGKLFNYYAAGVPVIGINIIGLKSVLDFKAGVLIDAVTPENIRKAISEVEANYESCSANCIRASRAFDFKTAFKAFISWVDERPPTKFNLRSFFTQGHERSVKTKKNILTSILIKCVSIVISFLLIPLALNYLNPVRYGIWIALTTVIGWFAFFDLGLGNGLRNKLAEALARNDQESARIYISTSYAVLSIIIGVVYVLFVLLFPLINWTWILNTPPEMSHEINRLIFIVFSFFSLQFIIKLISMVLKADQRSAISGGINTLASLLSLIVVYILTKTTHGSLFWLSVGVSAANIVAPFIVSVWFFSRDYRHLIPSWKYVRLGHARDLMSLGFQFFIMQFAALILFATDSIIIDQLYGPAAVTPYSIAFKYFSVVTMGFSLITTPFWTAYTDAYHKQDFEWIKRITRKQQMLWILLAAGVVIMLVLANFAYHIWIGDQVEIPFLLSCSMAVWVMMSAWTSIFGNFLSGVGKIRLSLYHSIVIIVINIPLSVFLAKYLNLGSAGVMIGTCLCVLPQVFLHPIQYSKIVHNTASGIWNK
ncbi:MAG: oligosaccharide flippase family protein [Bacteroidetes bacterium]|nr:oligosaccharide flippase family protein [Bacteroidota bacterium]